MLDANPEWKVQFKNFVLCMLAEITGTGRAKAKAGFAGNNTTSKSDFEEQNYLAKDSSLCLAFPSESYSHWGKGW
jgi:hypothetical protein